MIIENNVSLGKKTTFGIGGICSCYYIPETIEEMQDIFCCYPEAPLLAGGSNVVISDMREFPHVISLLKFCDEIINLGNGQYKVGASVRNQKLINTINKDGYGGIEYLFSVPGTVGGAIYMNAGTGKALGNFISQHIVSVDWFDGKKIITLSNNMCEFSYRHSYFHTHKGVIVSAIMKFDVQDMSTSQKLIEERIQRVNALQDHSGKSCGTLCKNANKNIMRIIKLLRLGNVEGVHFSNKTPNWLINSGKGSFEEFKKCLKVLHVLHKIMKKEYKLEIEVWD